jgi:hypothetical protein
MTTNKIAYGTEAAMTITLASLGTSSTWVAGRESNSVDNSVNLYLDYLISGQIMVGTSPSANTQIRVYAFSTVGLSATWPDVFDGTDSAETISSVGVGQGFLKRLATLNVDATTSDLGYQFGKVSLAQAFGGVVPAAWGLWVTHNTGVNLNATAGNHYVVRQGIATTNG